MSYVTEQIARTLRQAREGKGLSQRALSRKAGVPQSHISKIESGAVDLRLSSLIELARVLDLELELVPRKTVPAVQSIVRSAAAGAAPDTAAAGRALEEIARIRDVVAGLAKKQQLAGELAGFQRQLKDLQHFRLDDAALKSIREARNTLQNLHDNRQTAEAIRRLSAQFREMRTALAHAPAVLPKPATVRPAYSLDEEDGNG
jgi:transcriptional regulator with XRE-family HTH domain